MPDQQTFQDKADAVQDIWTWLHLLMGLVADDDVCKSHAEREEGEL